MSVAERQLPTVPVVKRERRVPELVSVPIAFFLAAACFVHFGVTAEAFISAIFVVVLVVLSVIDYERGLLPNRIVLPATAVILVLQLAFFPGDALEYVISTVGAGLFFLVLYLINRAGLGQGDVKFALLLGAGLGQGVVLGIFLGMFFAGIGGLVVIARRGTSARKDTIPLGPFLALGAIVSLFFHGDAFVSF